jgi:diguanylate cyclase (GGDEF)-like protein
VSAFRKSPLAIPTLVILLGVMASVFTWKRVSMAERGADELALNQRAWRASMGLGDAVDLEAETLRMIAAAAKQACERGQPVDLRGLLATKSQPEGSVRALLWAGWCQPLSDTEIAALEHERGPSFRVHSLDGRPLPAPADDDAQAAAPHWVLEQVTPPDPSEQLEGLDLSGVPGYARAIDAALASGRLALAAAPSAAGTTDGPHLLLAVYPTGASPAGGPDCSGVVVAELATQPLLDRALKSPAGPSEPPVHASFTDLNTLVGEAGPAPLPDGAPAEASAHVGGRIWKIEMQPAAAVERSYVEWLDRTSIVLPAAIFIVMCLVSWVVWLQQDQTFEIRKQVARHTATLRRQNMDLEDKERQLEETNRRLHEMSNTDPLTGLLNRRGFEVQLDRERERSRRTGTPCGLLFFDVDHFKGFNDRYGHAAGDEVLRRVAHLLGAEARRIDCVARYGGEEFVLLAAGTDAAGLVALAERIRARVESAGIANEASPLGLVTVSGGGALLGGPLASDVRAVFELADRCLYQAKSTGRNRVVMVT